MLKNFSAKTINAVTPGKSKFLSYDVWLLWSIIALLSLGLVMVFSASIGLPESAKYANYKPTHFLVRHAFAIATATALAWIIFHVPIATWQKLAPILFVITLLLLVIVLIPGVGKGVNGARRWLNLGLMNMQPSELMKVFCILYAADYTVRKQAVMDRFVKGFVPMAVVVALVGVLLLQEPDMGAFVVIVAIAFGILFLGGINAKIFSGLVVTLIGTFILMIATSEFRRKRILAFVNPWDDKFSQEQGYQLKQALIAFGRGEWGGVGLGGSLQKQHYLPEAHTDFLMAIVGEELGLIGVLIVIGLFVFIIKRAFDIGNQAIAVDRMYAALVAKGVGVWFGAQAFINIGVNLGLLPTKGLTLPLMSYGGSGILVNCIALAILMRVDYETRSLMRGVRL